MAESPPLLWACRRRIVQRIVAENKFGMNERLLRRVPSFANLSEEEISALANSLFEQRVTKNQTLLREGAAADAIFLVKQGSLSSPQKAGDAEPTMVGPGGILGEEGLLLPQGEGKWPQTLSAVTEVAVVLKLSRSELIAKLGAELPQVILNSFVRKVLRTIQLFDALNEEEVDQFMRSFHANDVPAGSDIVREGDGSCDFVILHRGTARATGSGPYAGRELNAGDYFGELALLGLPVNTNTITATSPVTTLSIDKQSFIQMLGPLEGIIVRENALRDKKAQGSKMPAIGRVGLHPVAPLGRGTFGTVELVWHEETQMPFCLKRIQKLKVVALKQTERTISELELMRTFEHPFIPRFAASFDEPDCVSLLLEVALGGELTSVIARSGGLGISHESARFYCANILSALAYLHRQKIIHRDVKPENVVLDHTGYVKLVDYGYAKQLKTSTSRTWTLCGTPQYMAPEVITSAGHGLAIDYWALGILTHEMLTGSVPFDADDAMRIYKAVLKGKVSFPKRLKQSAKDFVSKLLTVDATKRLGSQRGASAVEVAVQPFLKSLSIDALERRLLPAPHVPKVAGPKDASNFDAISDESSTEDWTHERWAWAHDRLGRARAGYEALAEAFGDPNGSTRSASR